MWQRPRACILPSRLPCKNRGGRSWASLTVSATCDPSASRRSPRRLLASSAEVLWRGAEAAGVADAMIEARHGTFASLETLRSACTSPCCLSAPPLFHALLVALACAQERRAMGKEPGGPEP